MKRPRPVSGRPSLHRPRRTFPTKAGGPTRTTPAARRSGSSRTASPSHRWAGTGNYSLPAECRWRNPPLLGFSSAPPPQHSRFPKHRHRHQRSAGEPVQQSEPVRNPQLQSAPPPVLPVRAQPQARRGRADAPDRGVSRFAQVPRAQHAVRVPAGRDERHQPRVANGRPERDWAADDARR